MSSTAVPFSVPFLNRLMAHLSITHHSDLLDLPVTILFKDAPLCLKIQEARRFISSQEQEEKGLVLRLSNGAYVSIEKDGRCCYQKDLMSEPEFYQILIGKCDKILSTHKGIIPFL